MEAESGCRTVDSIKSSSSSRRDPVLVGAVVIEAGGRMGAIQVADGAGEGGKGAKAETMVWETSEKRTDARFCPFVKLENHINA